MQKSLFIKLFVLFVSVNMSCLSLNAQKKSTTISTDNKITEKVLQEILDQNKHFALQGKVADYIPELGKMSAEAIAFSVVDANGKVISVGDTNKKFTMQSISKIIALMVAVQENGEETVFENMGYFGSDKPFNHFGSLEITGKPLNPMMNAGAILTVSMIKGEGETAFQKVLKMVRFITKNNNINYNEAVYLSEKETGHRNRGMFHIMKNSGLITGEENQLDNYFKQCSIEVTAEDLAKIGYFFANECVRFDGDATYKNADLSKLIQSQCWLQACMSLVANMPVELAYQANQVSAAELPLVFRGKWELAFLVRL